MIVLDLSILNQKGTPMFNSDTFANRPAFGIVGRIFISTDTKEFYRDTGTSWELIGGPGSGTITGSGAATQVAFWNGASTITGSNNLFWDSTNNYLGINTNAPTTALDVHHSTNSGAIFNQTNATNNNTINFQTTGTGRWRIGNFYTAGADDFGIFDVVGSLQQFTIVNTTGQTFIGAKTTASGRLVVNSATADAHLQIVGANAPSIRIDNAGSGGTQRFVFGLATATNNFIQGATAGQFCISTQSSGAMLFGMWQSVNATEAMRISTANNVIVGSSVDIGNRFQVTGTSYFSSNVGIGSFPLARRLEVLQATGGNAASIGLFAAGPTLAAAIGFQPSTNNLQIAATSGIIFYTGSTIGGIATEPTNQRMFLDSSGNLGIGTSSPVYKLDVRGTGYFSSPAFSFQLTLGDSTNGTTSAIQTLNNNLILYSNVGAGEAARITSTNNLLVGTNTDVGAKLRVNGDISCAVDLRLSRTSASPAIITDQAAIRLVNQTLGDTITLNIQNNGIRFGGTIRTDAPGGSTNPDYKLGRYNAVAPLATGYLDIEVGGVVYKVLAST
jgi:hypothetical protein